MHPPFPHSTFPKVPSSHGNTALKKQFFAAWAATEKPQMETETCWAPGTTQCGEMDTRCIYGTQAWEDPKERQSPNAKCLLKQESALIPLKHCVSVQWGKEKEDLKQFCCYTQHCQEYFLTTDWLRRTSKDFDLFDVWMYTHDADNWRINDDRLYARWTVRLCADIWLSAIWKAD